MAPAELPTATSSDRCARGRFALGVLSWALWFGILTGWLELLNLGFRKYILGSVVLLGGHTLWMAPLADAAVFLLLSVVLLPLVVLRPGHFAERVAIFVCAFTLTASLALLHREIHNCAAALLSIGVAAQTLRWLSPRIESFDRLVRRSLPRMAAACLTAAVALPTWWVCAERWAIRALPEARQGAPNVLLIIWDTVRAQSLSTYGYGRDTSPNLTRLGQEGVVFEHAIAPSPWTLPSHASFFTGRWADELGASWARPLDDACPTLAEALRSQGYVTAGFVANQAYCSHAHGLRRGFVHYEDFNVLGTELVLSCQIGRRLTTSPRLRKWIGWTDFWGRKSAERIDRDFLRWLDRRPDRPFFAFLNYYDAHQPYRPPPSFEEQFGDPKRREGIPFEAQLRYAAPQTPDALTPQQYQGEQDAYDASIAYLDACLARLLGELDKRGLLENTLLIVTSDHGEHFGEHHLRDHGNSLYRALLQVPLVIRFPGSVPAGRRIREAVSLRELPATVTDLAGCNGACQFPGGSLRRCWEATKPEGSPGAPLYACLRPPYFRPNRGRHLDAVVADRLWYIRHAGGREELFDFLSDPWELCDLSSAEEVRDRLLYLRALLARHLAEPSTDLASASRGPTMP